MCPWPPLHPLRDCHPLFPPTLVLSCSCTLLPLCSPTLPCSCLCVLLPLHSCALLPLHTSTLVSCWLCALSCALLVLALRVWEGRRAHGCKLRRVQGQEVGKTRAKGWEGAKAEGHKGVRSGHEGRA